MKIFKEELKRREFIKRLTAGGFAMIYGCSKKSVNPDSNFGSVPPSQNSKVALVKTDNRIDGVKKVMELLDFPTMENHHVVVKPNFNTADPPPASTHNDTLAQLMTEIKNRGASDITLAERSFHNFESVISTKGIDKMAANLGFGIKFLGDDDYTVFKQNTAHWADGFRLPKTISNAQYIVSTCCLKTHHTGVITLSLKLSVGILPSLHMQELHGSADINKMIAEINLAYKPKLIIMDGITTFIDGGPSKGTEKRGDVMLAGTDRIAVDAVGTAILKDLESPRIIGDIFEQKQIKHAVNLNIGIKGPDQIEFVTGDEISRKYSEKLKTILDLG